jgi:hypothetical protein
MIAGTLTRLPAAVPQTFSYLAYFIHLREYADKVVAREWKFNYELDEMNTSPNRFGEGGVINMVRREAQQSVPRVIPRSGAPKSDVGNPNTR